MRTVRRLRWRLFLAFIAAAAVSITPASADVRTATARAFSLSTTRMVKAPQSVAYETLVTRLPAWWDPAHTWSGKAANLVLDARAGGCFCESLPSGGSVQHAQVIFMQPPDALRLRGSLGPLQELAAVGILTFTFKPADQGTAITLTYSVGGELPDDQGKLAKLVDQVLTLQLERLARFIDTGSPAAP
jgi:uncharacterized protein YndB with AHSA1/START domain